MTQEIFFITCTAILFLGVLLWRLSLKFPVLRRVLMALYLVIQVCYLIWRFTSTIPFDSTASTAFGSLLLLTEVLAFMQTFIFIILFWKEEKTIKAEWEAGDLFPSVDIFIATYNEEVSLLEKTIVAATLTDYPAEKRTIYLCDDGNRAEMAEAARQWGIHYLARPQHKHAKAGNLNYALDHSTSEFVVTMDADMMLKKEFLKEVIPYFKNKEMGFVQTPQAFHNPDVFQHNLYAEANIRNDQDFFMRYLQPAKNRFNAAIYVGSNAIFRRTALDSIGGFVEGVITEDMATGLLLQNNNWKSYYLNKVLATGLSPETFKELIKQRVRWARGNVQVVKKFPPFQLKNLSMIQKLLYLDGVHYWFFGVYHFLYLLFPIVSVLLGVQIINDSSHIFLPVWLVSYLLSNMVYSAVSGSQFRPMWASVAELAIFPKITWAVLQELFVTKRARFEVTSKGQTIKQRKFHWQEMGLQILFLFASVVSLGVIVNHVIQNPAQELSYWALPLFWLTYNTFSLSGALHIAVDRPRHKEELINYYCDGMISNFRGDIPVNILKIHSKKAVLSFDSSSAIPFNEGEEWHLSTENLVGIPVRVLKTFDFPDENLISVQIETLTQSNFVEVFKILDTRNTERFKKRTFDYRKPAYHLTIGYYLRRYQSQSKLIF